MKKLSNISVSQYRSALSKLGLSKLREKGGHEAWFKEGMTRPVIFQTHVEPVPEFIVKNGIRDIGVSKEEFLAVLED